MLSVSNGDSAVVQAPSSATHFNFLDSSFAAYLGKQRPTVSGRHFLTEGYANMTFCCLTNTQVVDQVPQV